MKQNEQQVSVSAEMEQMLLLLEKFGEIAKNLLEKSKLKKQKHEQDQNELDEPQEEQLSNGILAERSSNKQQISFQSPIDPELKNFLEQFYQEFLVVRNNVNKKNDAVQTNQSIEKVEKTPENSEQAAIARGIDTLEKDLEGIEKQVEEVRLLPDSSQEKVTLLQKIGANLIRFENNRLALQNKIDTFFKTLPNQIELKFTKWMHDRMEGLTNRVAELHQQININKQQKSEQIVRVEPPENEVHKDSENKQENSKQRDVKSSDYPLLMQAGLIDIGNSIDGLKKSVIQMLLETEAEIERVRIQEEKQNNNELSKKAAIKEAIIGVQTEIDPKASSMESIKCREAAGIVTTAPVIEELEEVTMTEYGEPMEEAYQNSADPDPDVAAFPTDEQRAIEAAYDYDPEDDYEPEH